METTAKLEGSIFTRLSNLFLDDQTITASILKTFTHVFQFYPGSKLDVHLTILTSFLSSLITSSTLNGQISLPCRIKLNTHAQYNLPFALKGKPLLANKDD